MAVQERLQTANDLWEFCSLPENEDKFFELIEGVIYEVTPSSIIPSIIASRLDRAVGVFVDAHDLGYVSMADGGFELSSKNVIAPDVGFIAKGRVSKLPERYFQGAPDLAIEVVSPTDSGRAVQRKALKYLAYGTRLVWVVYPEDKVVDVYRPAPTDGALIQEIGIDGVLDGGDVLPGFSLSVKDIFKDLGEKDINP